MLRVGLTGGIGTGKSTVGKMFADLGCHVLDSDGITRELFQAAQPTNILVAKAFGPSIVAKDGSIDRAKLGELVFNDEGLRHRLNGIVHPMIVERQKSFLDAVEREDPHGIGIVEAALMVEVGTYNKYDKLVVVVCKPSVQRRRLRERNGLTPEQVRARIKAQMPLEEKAKFADFIVENSKTIESTQKQVEEIYRELCALELTRTGETEKRD